MPAPAQPASHARPASPVPHEPHAPHAPHASLEPPEPRRGVMSVPWPWTWTWTWPWPLPAVAVWAVAWLGLVSGYLIGLSATAAFLLACCTGLLGAWRCTGIWRRGIAAGGFPLSAWALGAAHSVPAWAWLLMLLPVLAAYPLRAWRDAPFFPTPAQALQGLDGVVGTPSRVLDAGCGLGDGLLALRRLWPQAELQGVEWSRPLSWLAAWRCRGPGMRVRSGDMWQTPWADYDLVYLFQRPESMARAFDKAAREMDAQGWLVSLEFAVPGREPWASVQGEGRRPLWIYRPAAGGPRSESP